MKLLANKEVLQWIRGDLSFLKTKDKAAEDSWGRKVLRNRRPDLKVEKQWSGKLGEYLCEELYEMLGKKVSGTQVKKNGYTLDMETEDFVIEVKTETFRTTGTATEKIPGCPYKYAEVPTLFSKPLKIVCVGGAEKKCKEKMELFGEKRSPSRQIILDCYKSLNIEYVAASELLTQALHLHGIQDSLN
jgi:hypothetical protein